MLSRQAICARIERKDGSWGVMAVAHRRATDMSHTDVSFIQAVANVLGAVVARAREEQLEAQLQQSRRLESVGKLAGGVAHDFNNLLAVILNYADFALEAATDAGQRRDLEELSKAATRGAELVRQLLAFSRRRPVGRGGARPRRRWCATWSRCCGARSASTSTCAAGRRASSLPR